MKAKTDRAPLGIKMRHARVAHVIDEAAVVEEGAVWPMRALCGEPIGHRLQAVVLPICGKCEALHASRKE